MGVEQSTYGGLVLDLHKPYFYPGDSVSGNCYVNLMNQFPSSGIELRIYAVEKTSWLDYDNIRQEENYFNQTTNRYEKRFISKRIDRPRTGTRTLFEFTQMISTFNNSFMGVGQYSYPFQFMIPNGMPGSFEYYDHELSASITYFVEARIMSMDFNSIKHIHNQQVLIVRQSPNYFQYPTQLSKTGEVSNWCSSKGFSTVNVSYPKNNFCMGESVQVIAELDNTKCSLPATSINLELHQKIMIKSNDGHSKYLNRIVTSSHNLNRYPENQISCRTLDLTFKDTNNPTFKHIGRCGHRNLYNDTNLVSKLQASVKASIIECSYYLKVHAEFEGCRCCDSPPAIEIPVLIYIPDLRIDMSRYKPQNWNPQVMPNFDCKINVSSGGMMSGVGAEPMPNMNVNINSGGMMTGGTDPMNNNNNNNNMNVNVNSGGMMTGGTDPMSNNNNNNNNNNNMGMNVNVNSGGMMTGGTDPMNNNNNNNNMGMNVNVNSGGMMTGGTDPTPNNNNTGMNMNVNMSGGMMTGGTEPMSNDNNNNNNKYN